MKKKLIYISITILAISTLAGGILFAVKYIREDWARTKEKPFILADTLINEAPGIKVYFQDKMFLLRDVQSIFDRHKDEFFRVRGRGENIVVYYEESNFDKGEDLADSKVFSAEEKKKISALFCEGSPIDDYYGPYWIDTHGIIETTNLTNINIQFLQENEIQGVSYNSYYMEEFAEGWFICVTINWLFVDRESVAQHKADLPGHGLTRLTDKGMVLSSDPS